MQIVWEPYASAVLDELIDYRITVAGVKSAEKLLNKILSAVNSLAEQPLMGAVQPLPERVKKEFRSLLADREHKIIYRIDGETVIISALFDCRQDPDSIDSGIKE